MHIFFFPKRAFTKDNAITNYRLMTSLYRKIGDQCACVFFETGRERLGGVSFHTFQLKTNQKYRRPRGHSFNRPVPSSTLRYFHHVYVDEKERCSQEPASF